MAKEKSLVEEAIIQMKNLEEAVAENAKGILASTMKQEIKDLVKESLSEQDDEEVDTEVDVEDDADIDMEADDDMEADNDLGDEDMDDEDMDMDMDMDMDSEDVIDLTGQPSSEVLKVFQLLGPEDQIVVTKGPNGNINLKDNETNKEYMIVGENIEEDEDYLNEYSDSDDFMNEDDEMEDDFMNEDDEMEDWSTEEMDEEESIDALVERVFGDDSEEDDEFDYDSDSMGGFGLDEDMDMMGDSGVDQLGEDDDNIVYEIEFNDEDEDDFDEDEFEFDIDEDMEEPVMEGKKMARKAPGVGMGKPKFSYDSKPNQDLPTKKQKHGGKGIGFGSVKKGTKFDADKDNGQMDGEFRVKPKKVEAKEASRTYGNGSKSGRGLRKGITPNRNLTFEGVDNREMQLLREKNEEYRKALNIFRNKLNEVAVFNSNLAYATRLFTEHSTSKQEKINILRRFDSVETIKESKNLYHQVKDELSASSNQSSINESFERVIEKAPSTGSAVNLIESKTYENPQFLRMKDLMSKLR
jgi:hypothetical protein